MLESLPFSFHFLFLSRIKTCFFVRIKRAWIVSTPSRFSFMLQIPPQFSFMISLSSLFSSMILTPSRFFFVVSTPIYFHNIETFLIFLYDILQNLKSASLNHRSLKIFHLSQLRTRCFRFPYLATWSFGPCHFCRFLSDRCGCSRRPKCLAFNAIIQGPNASLVSSSSRAGLILSICSLLPLGGATGIFIVHFFALTVVYWGHARCSMAVPSKTRGRDHEDPHTVASTSTSSIYTLLSVYWDQSPHILLRTCPLTH